MFDMFLTWYKKRFSDPQIVALFISIVMGFCIILFFHDILAPLLVSIVLAYLLEGPTQQLSALGLSRLTSVSIVFIFFISISAMFFLIIVPIIWQQGMNLLLDLPSMVNSFNKYAKALPERYPDLVDVGIIDMILNNLRNRLSTLGESVVKYSVASLIGIITIAIYLVLVPFIIFFLLKDKTNIINGLQRILPKDRLLVGQVWQKMNKQITNYIRGKVIEMIIVGLFSYISFIILELRYSLFLSVIISISVLIPYIGAIVVTIPVVLVALFQWGVGSEFCTLLITYLIIQGLDGNLLVPIIFSEIVNLHPLIIILSIVVFGGLWGFWGVFFAIPLATLIKAILDVCPERS
ncbi:pheromone autoinducer 2 transporter [Candidatus Arsenophonus lipoptenae]|uniref:Pheromone autoinducer 2 transporter n=1 Tax=Candidatus Arsenophonus lipoptenae TaxID=634113 RepID=A0A0X9VVV6_9GAMM|nr:AI-2E family transporter [Candidatus Arsenophonus lipoptenae]AMA65133.1 pheromone autoinducer 2 transporter [Candidatus Arsenophonus lipoptenae]